MTFEVLFSFLFPFLIFAGVIFFIAKFGGWKALAEKYPQQVDFPTSKKSFQSARIGNIGKYNNCLTVGVNQFGMGIKVFFPLSLFHPPLFFPWEKIKNIEKKKFLFTSFVEIILFDSERKIQLTDGIFKKYPEYIPHKFKKESQNI